MWHNVPWWGVNDSRGPSTVYLPLRFGIFWCAPITAFLACGPPCTTTCGLSSNTDRCEELLAQEHRALQSFSINVDHWAQPWTCQQLEGFSVYADPDLVSSVGADILGYTNCARKEIVIMDERWSTNAFTHELGHVIESCLGPPTIPAWHYGWEVRRINAAINNATLTQRP